MMLGKDGNLQGLSKRVSEQLFFIEIRRNPTWLQYWYPHPHDQ